MVNWKIAKPKPRYEDLMEDMLCKVDIKFKQLQTLMMDHYTGIVKVVKEGSTSYDKCGNAIPSYRATSPFHVCSFVNSIIPIPVAHHDATASWWRQKLGLFSDKILIISRASCGVRGANSGHYKDPPQFHNEHNIDVKTDNIVEDFEQSSKVGGNEGGADERVTESVSGYTNKAQEEEMYNTAAEIDKGPRDEFLKLLTYAIFKATLVVSLILVTMLLQLFLRKEKDENYTAK
ncbi:hypothetical protein FXO38_30417 [Capsicum annuum]|nr:hypothetical protein FXO38_30417 [Capsicum annuum]KAF3636358.1 hypothetical protein FXO37_25471 [Capsicum annuum]